MNSRHARARSCYPATRTCSRPCHPASACGPRGFASEIRDDAAGLRATLRRIDRNPLGSAAGFGTPGLPISRESTRARLGFREVHEPVTAVQLSRGKAEAQFLFEVTLLMQDLGRLASDLLLFYTREFGFIDIAPELTTGSSIMPQKRNPDVLELIRGRSATALACLVEALGITSRLPSGYQRDLQLLKAPLFRSIDIAMQVLGPRAGDTRRRDVPAGTHPARRRHPCDGTRECARGAGRPAFPRSLPARGYGEAGLAAARSRRARSMSPFTSASWSRKSPSSAIGTRYRPSMTSVGTLGSRTLRDWSSARFVWSWTLNER